MGNVSQLDIAPRNSSSPTFETTNLVNAVAIVSRFVKKIKNHVQDGIVFTDVVDKITPDSLNPEKIKVTALKREMQREMLAEAASSNGTSRHRAGEKSKATESPPSSPSRSNGGTNRQSKKHKPTKATLRRGEKSKTDKKSLGWLHCKCPPTKVLPVDLSIDPLPCAYFAAKGFECNHSSNKCSRTHVAIFSKFSESDQTAILEKMHEDEGKSVWLDKETFEKHDTAKLIPKDFKYLLGDENGPDKRT